MAFAIKSGVYGSLKPEMDVALNAVQSVWRLHKLGTPTITSIEDGKHKTGSFHYQGLAFDIRLNDVPLNLHATLRSDVAAIAGNDYDVVHEYHGTSGDHLHIEYDPEP